MLLSWRGTSTGFRKCGRRIRLNFSVSNSKLKNVGNEERCISHMFTRGVSFFSASEPSRFKSIQVQLTAEIPTNLSESFRSDLAGSIAKWKSSGLRGVWLSLPLSCFHLAPICKELGFSLHHCEETILVMNMFLLPGESSMPKYASHTVGVAGCVFDPETHRVLVVRDTGRYVNMNNVVVECLCPYLNAKTCPLIPEIWKFPGGFSEPAEDISSTVKREVFEETGIRSEFRSVLAFRQHHQIPTSFGLSDIYVVCRMHPLSRETNPCESEIVECKWRHLDELRSSLKLTPLMKRILDLLSYGVEKGFDKVDIESEEFDSIYPGKTYRLYHRPITDDN